jgi:hypothetical protein
MSTCVTHQYNPIAVSVHDFVEYFKELFLCFGNVRRVAENP